MRLVHADGDLVGVGPAHGVGIPSARRDVRKRQLRQLGHVRLPGHAVEHRHEHGTRRLARRVEQIIADAAHETEEHAVVNALVHPVARCRHIIEHPAGTIVVAQAGIRDLGRFRLAADGAGALHVHGAVIRLDGRPGAPVVHGIIILPRLRDALAALEIVHGAAIGERHGIDRLHGRVEHTVLRGRDLADDHDIVAVGRIAVEVDDRRAVAALAADVVRDGLGERGLAVGRAAEGNVLRRGGEGCAVMPAAAPVIAERAGRGVDAEVRQRHGNARREALMVGIVSIAAPILGTEQVRIGRHLADIADRARLHVGVFRIFHARIRRGVDPAGRRSAHRQAGQQPRQQAQRQHQAENSFLHRWLLMFRYFVGY